MKPEPTPVAFVSDTKDDTQTEAQLAGKYNLRHAIWHTHAEEEISLLFIAKFTISWFSDILYSLTSFVRSIMSVLEHTNTD